MRRTSWHVAIPLNPLSVFNKQREAILRPGRALVRRLQVRQKLIVVGVRTDPEPNHCVAVEHAHGAVADSHTCRIGRRIGTDLLEVQPR